MGLRACRAGLLCAGRCWASHSRHHTVIAHHSSLLGHPLGLDVQYAHPVCGQLFGVWRVNGRCFFPYGGLFRAWTRSRRMLVFLALTADLDVV